MARTKITLSEDQLGALATALGLDEADVAGALHAANKGASAAPPAGESGPQRLSRADVQKLAREGRNAEIVKARTEGRIDYTPKDAA